MSRLVAMSVGLLGATIFVSPARTQSRVTFVPTASTGANLSRGAARTSFAHQRRARRFFDGAAFAPYYDYDNDYGRGTIESPPPYIIVQTQPALSAPAPKSPESLVLELRGDHWVRITNYGQSQTEQSSQPESEQASNSPSSILPATTRRTQAAVPRSPLPPAVLVFRDGHEEQVEKYVIKGTTIYTSADYWTTGTWTRKVEIVELDVPSTLKLNQERGAKFSLPSGPNEVMIRP
jgi:hypothetical protein